MSKIREAFKEEVQQAAYSLVEQLPITTPRLRALSDDEVQALHELVEKVNSAAEENEKIAEVQQNAAVIVKLLSRL